MSRSCLLLNQKESIDGAEYEFLDLVQSQINCGTKLFWPFANDHNVRIAMRWCDEFVKYGQYTALGFPVVFMAILKQWRLVLELIEEKHLENISWWYWRSWQNSPVHL